MITEGTKVNACLGKKGQPRKRPEPGIIQKMLSLEAGQRQEVEQSKLLILTRLKIQSRVWIAYLNFRAEQEFMGAALRHRLL